MWAMQYHRYGDETVLQREGVPLPALRRGEVLTETVSSGVSAIDALYRSGRVRAHGLRFPKQPGFDAVGIVRESRAAAIRPGRWVWSVLGLEPFRARGTAVEFLRVDAGRVGLFPAGFTPSVDVGGLALGALTALVAVRDRARTAAGSRALVVGAGGAVGTAAVQLARAAGATVDAVCGARGRDVCLALGAATAHRHDDPGIEAVRRSAAYETVIVATGNPAAWLGALRPGGRAAVTRGDAYLRALPAAARARRTMRSVAAGHSASDLTLLAEMVAAGALVPIIDRTYRIDDLATAHRELGHGGSAGARLVVHRTA